MDIDKIIEQHRDAISTRQQLRKSKSFSFIFWEEFKNRTELLVIRIIVLAFPIIAIFTAVIMAAVLCEGWCSTDCCSDCILCTQEFPICVFSMFLSLIPLPLFFIKGNTTAIIADILILIVNLITIGMFDGNRIIAFIAYILYMIFLYLMFRKPFLKWHKLNK